MITAVYQAAEELVTSRKRLTLNAHDTADLQTGALGDVEITIASDDKVLTSYEIKDKGANRNDINRALQKILLSNQRLDNDIFITTEPVHEDLQNYMQSLYHRASGTEFVVLNYIGFIRHFLHLFHRLRAKFLTVYQALLLAEPQVQQSASQRSVFGYEVSCKSKHGRRKDWVDATHSKNTSSQHNKKTIHWCKRQRKTKF